MKMIIIIAWRNIWRRPARSGVLLAAIISGLWAGVVAVGTMNGMMNQRVNYLIDSEITHVQIHHPEFLSERRPSDFIQDIDEITPFLSEQAEVVSFSVRNLADGMLQSPVKASGVRIRGINPEMEQQTTTFYRNIVEGDYLSKTFRNPVIIGQSMADEHKLRIGDRIVLTFEDLEGQLTSAAFNITGIFKSASTDFDKMNVFVLSEDMNRYFGSDIFIHEIAVLLTHSDASEEISARINDRFPQIHAQTWKELSPELSTIVELSGVMLFIITLIIMAALAFGILNTMLMALFERMREIGMLISIGMSRKKVFSMILLESLLLTLAGALAGLLLAWLSVSYLAINGVNFGMFAEGIAELGWDHIVYPVLTTAEYISILVLVAGVSFMSAVYPAYKAIRIHPLEASKGLT
jgi:ABC-type lipoprotein release transport system permease subunit